MAGPDPLITTEWLDAHRHDPNLRIVDMRGAVTTRVIAPGVEEADYRGAPDEYAAGHIPGAVYIDWTLDIIDPDDPVPAQIAPADRFAAVMGARGIDNTTHVVAVDHSGGQFATRLWWALKSHGHDRVSVLDGGMKRWIAEGRPLETGPATVAPRVFHPHVRPAWRITAEALRDRLGQTDFQLLDARDREQYTATKRRGPRGGHIPGAIHVPRSLFLAESGGFLPVDEVRRRIQEAGVVENQPVVAYCNGGVAATVALFQLDRLGYRDLTNYDGSWNEWGQRPDLPIETGDSPS